MPFIKRKFHLDFGNVFEDATRLLFSYEYLLSSNRVDDRRIYFVNVSTGAARAHIGQYRNVLPYQIRKYLGSGWKET